MQAFVRGRLDYDWRTRRGRNWREAYLASRFAVHIGAERINLLHPDGVRPTPDFAVLLNGKQYIYETTEVMRTGRRRATEQINTSFVHVPDDEWSTAAECAAQVKMQSEKKAKKPYPNCHGLLIYANFGDVSNPALITPSWWQSNTAIALSKFSEVWVFDGSNFFRIDIP